MESNSFKLNNRVECTTLIARRAKKNNQQQTCLLCLKVSLGFYSMRSFLEVFEMVVNKKSTQFLPEIDKISSLSLDKGEELTGD